MIVMNGKEEEKKTDENSPDIRGRKNEWKSNRLTRVTTITRKKGNKAPKRRMRY